MNVDITYNKGEVIMIDQIVSKIKDEKIKEAIRVSKFLFELNRLCEKHDMSISHEDGHGNFIIENYKSQNIEWMCQAEVRLPVKVRIF